MSILVYFILGILTSLLFPPYFFLPLGFIIFPLICLLLDSNKQKFSYLDIYKNFSTFGFGFFISFLFWLKNPFFVFEETKNFFLVFILLIILLTIILSSIFILVLKLGRNIPIFFIIPFMFTIAEYVISIFLQGFPWFTFSLVISSNDYLLFSLKSFGTLISSYLIIQIFCIPFVFLTKYDQKNEFKFFTIFIAIPILSFLILNFILKEDSSKTNKINLEIFQLNFKNNDKSLTDHDKFNGIIKHINDSNADLLIFGENNFPYLLDNFELKIIKNSLKENQILIIGATRIENNKYYNSLLNITSTEVNYFDKKILVPFGEFLPLRETLTFLKSIVGPNNYSKGEKERIINITNNISYIPVICYEILFYWKLINKLNSKSSFVVNITNDFWFGNYLGPYQHLYLAKLRAAEFNKPIIRVSNNGVSAIINNSGTIIKYTNLNKIEKFQYSLLVKDNINFVYFHSIIKLYFLITFIIMNIYYFRKNVE